MTTLTKGQRVHYAIKGTLLKIIPMMLTCEEFEDFISDYFEGNLPAVQRRVFNLHLKVCRECRDYLSAYQRSIEIGKAVFEEANAPIPGDVPEDLVKAILDARDH